ncbi:MAG: hypothetical protein OXF25_07510 [Cyanobacteria bacterium MAG CAR3_bin_5]|nr:hypothetical protein [Cyanobacteria bacterium MAG CAR3_bin_5]
MRVLEQTPHPASDPLRQERERLLNEKVLALLLGMERRNHC